MMPTGYEFRAHSLEGIKVSILVLLDDAYRHAGLDFTPEDLKMFQSLFFWMMPTGDLKLDGEILDEMFQSLFFWMMPTG